MGCRFSRIPHSARAFVRLRGFLQTRADRRGVNAMSVPVSVETMPLPLDRVRRDAVERGAASLDERWMRDLLVRLVETPSPFGEEQAIAELLANAMGDIGLSAEVQALDSRSANAIGRLEGAGGGPELLLFAPLDSPFTGRPEDEVPWVGDSLPDHMIPRAIVGEGTVTGLSADNPKAHIVSILSAVRAVLSTGVELHGGLTVAFGAGGAPANPRPGDDRPVVGHGRGCRHMLDRGLAPDFAVIAKPGYAVAWEEVGLCWFRVRVRGVQTYVGRKHFLAYRNPIADAARVVTRLEAWFDEYARTPHRRAGRAAGRGRRDSRRLDLQALDGSGRLRPLCGSSDRSADAAGGSQTGTRTGARRNRRRA